MSEIARLKNVPAEQILQELRKRHDQAPDTAALVDNTSDLADFDDATLASAAKSNQKLIYGTDDRVDIYQLPAGPNLEDADSVVALFWRSDVQDNGDGTSTLNTQNFGVAKKLCPKERFRDQPIGAFCSGFLVAPDIIATAGHCVNKSNVTTVRFVFGFRMLDATNARTVISNSEIYTGVDVIAREEIGTGADFAVVRLDRSVPNHRVVRLRRAGKIADGEAVHVIGHPVGLPTKFAAGAIVRDNSSSDFFVANLDTYGGNSGSPVFNTVSREVEGILARGDTDFVQQGDCSVSLVCPTTGCRGEDCTRATVLAEWVPSF